MSTRMVFPMYSTNYFYTYDPNGNLLAGPDFTNPAQTGTRTITYNGDDMPQSIDYTLADTTSTINFAYDSDNKRAKKSLVNGKTTYYIGDNYQVEDDSGTIKTTKFIFAGNLRIAKITDNTTHYFHKDHLGSSSVMSDASGNAVETTEYLPYGHERSIAGVDISDYKFTDQEKDKETQLYNYDARLYDPVTGQFTMADTIVPDMYNPQSLNRYAYCLNNPVRYVDPSGHMTKTYNKDYGGPQSWDAKQDKTPTDYWGGPREPNPLTSLEVASAAYFIGIENPIIGPVLGLVGWSLGINERISSLKKDKIYAALKKENERLKNELNNSKNGSGNNNSNLSTTSNSSNTTTDYQDNWGKWTNRDSNRSNGHNNGNSRLGDPDRSPSEEKDFEYSGDSPEDLDW